MGSALTLKKKNVSIQRPRVVRWERGEEVDGGERRGSPPAGWALQQKAGSPVYVKGCETSPEADLQSCPVLQGSEEPARRNQRAKARTHKPFLLVPADGQPFASTTSSAK